MDPNLLVAALEKNLDSLESIINWSVFTAILAIWAGINRKNEIELFGLKLTRQYAAFLAGTIFTLVNFASIIFIFRVRNILHMVGNDQEYFVKAITTVSAHRWVLNPFGFFGGSDFFGSTLLFTSGFGGLIVVWWIGNTALVLLSERKSKPILLLAGLFLVCGLVSMYGIFSVFQVVLAKKQLLPPDLAANLSSAMPERIFAVIAGSVIGGLFFAILMRRKPGESGSGPPQQTPGAH